MRGKWTQDTADYSWTLVDDDGCFYRVARSYDRSGEARWVVAWTEKLWRGVEPVGSAVRIGGTYNTVEQAQAAIEHIASIAGAEAALSLAHTEPSQGEK